MVDSYAIRKYREVAKSLREQGRTKEAETAERKARELEQKPSSKEPSVKTTTRTTTRIIEEPKKKKYHAPSDAERVAREGVGKIQEAFETAQEKKKSELIKEKATKYEAEAIKNIDKVRKSPPGSIFKINKKEVSREEALKMLEKNREELAQARITSGRNIGLSTQYIEQLKTEAKQLPAEIKKKKYKVINTKEGLVVVAPKEEKTVGIISGTIKKGEEFITGEKTLNVPEVSAVIKKSVEQKPKIGKKLEFEIKEPDYDKMIKQFRKDWSRATTGQKLTLATSAALSKESWEGLGSMVTRSARKREEVMARHWARVKNQTAKEAFIRGALEAPVSAPMMPLTMFGVGGGSTALLGSVANAGRIGAGLSKVASASLGAMAVGGTVVELGGIEESWKKGRKEEAIGKGAMLTEAWVGAIAGSLSVRKKIGKKTTKLKLDRVKIRSIRKTEPKTINNVKNLRRVKIVELKYKDPKGKTYSRKNYIYEQETTVRGLTKKRLYLYDTKSKTLKLISNRDAAKLEAILYKSGKTQILYREEGGYSAGVETKKGLFKKVKKTGEITRERIGTREMIVQSTKGQKSVYARSGDILKTSIEGQKKSLKLRPFEEVGIASKKTAVGAGKIKTVGGKIKYSFLEKEYKPSVISDVLKVLTTKPSGKKPTTKVPSTKKLSSVLNIDTATNKAANAATKNLKSLEKGMNLARSIALMSQNLKVSITPKIKMPPVVFPSTKVERMKVERGKTRTAPPRLITPPPLLRVNFGGAKTGVIQEQKRKSKQKTKPVTATGLFVETITMPKITTETTQLFKPKLYVPKPPKITEVPDIEKLKIGFPGIFMPGIRIGLGKGSKFSTNIKSIKHQLMKSSKLL